MKLENKRIIITGGTSGIGYETVKQLYKTNEIIVLSKNAGRLGALTQEFKNVTTYQANLSKLDEIEVVADRIVKQYDMADVLINNAAVQYTPTFLDDDFKYETISQEITINFTAICCLSYLLLPALLKNTSSIILNVNSGLGLAPKTSSAIYCATKGAVNLFSKSLRYQLEQSNIKVLQAIMPLVDTKMTYGRGKNKMTSREAAQKLIYGIEQEIPDNDIGKVRLLRLLLRLAPSLAHRIMKGQ